MDGKNDTQLSEEKELCLICNRDIVHRVKVSCGHSFCGKCLMKGHSGKNKCPKCNSPIDQISNVMVIDDDRLSFKHITSRDEELGCIQLGNLFYTVHSKSGMNNFNWIFYVRDPTGRSLDWIDRIRVILHPTFNPPEVTLKKEPFQIQRLGWGTFVIQCEVFLKAPLTSAGRKNSYA